MSTATDTPPGEMKITATPAGRGTSANVVCSLGGSSIHRDRIDLNKAADRKRYAKTVIQMMGDGFPIHIDDIDAELISVAEKLENEAAKPSIAPESVDGDELDASQVIRPELIVRDDVSAIAIPRIVRALGTIQGQWLHYVRVGDDRRCDRMSDSMKVTDDAGLWLAPMPSEPTAGDVKDLNRWSAANRQSWLRGESTTTTARVLRMVAERIDRYVVLPRDDADGHGLTLAAWVMMTYAYPALPALPYLYLSGPPNSGKTRTMDVLSRMVFRPMMTGNASAATIFRSRHAFGGVLLLDEAERMRDTRSPDVAELLSILLSGYRRGGRASRCEAHGDSYRNVSFDCYGPVVLGCIKGLPPALASRCITVRMMRAGKSDPQVSRSLDDSPEEASAVLDALHCWSLDHAHDAMTGDCPPSSLSCRDAELWEPLLRIVAHSGDAAALSMMVHHAERMTQSAVEDSAPEYDGLILSAYYRLRRDGEIPTAGDVLEKAKLIDTESFDHDWKPRMVAGILRRYFTLQRSNGRKVYRDDPDDIADIAGRYGYDIGGTE